MDNSMGREIHMEGKHFWRESSDSEGHYVSSVVTSSELNILLINLVQKLFFYLVSIRDVLITNFSDLKVKQLKTIFCLLYLF